MIEYRIQQKRNYGWEFVTDKHGKYYTYLTLATAKKYGPNHVWNQENFRIVMADIDWQPVDLAG